MISVEDARALVSLNVRRLPVEVEETLSAALGRVLGVDVCADAYFPAMDCSMMDGYAIDARDVSPRFRVIGEVPAGTLPRMKVGVGECVRIFTGAPLPTGTNLVIPQEEVEADRQVMTPNRRSPKRWVRERGTEGTPGQIVVAANARLGGAELSALAQAGCPDPPIRRPLSVVHIASGDELVDAAEIPPLGKIRETNSLLVAGLLQPFGGNFQTSRRGDVLGDLVAAIPIEDDDADLILISGGASVGEYDFGVRALKATGFTLHFERVNLRPGKPLIFGSRGSQAAFVIPGNPVSHFVCFHTVIRRAVESFLGITPHWSFLEVQLGGSDLIPCDARETFWPAHVVVKNGALVANPLRWSSSGDTFSLVGANALIRVPNHGDGLVPGGPASMLLLDVPGAH